MSDSVLVPSPVSRFTARWPLGARSVMIPVQRLAFIACLLVSALAAQAALFSANATIEEGDTTYDGQDITVSNCTLTVNGRHNFASLSLIQNATLTHPACTADKVYAVDLTITGALTIDAASKIDVTERGYLPGWTSGNSTNGVPEYAGGSYGGLGGGVGPAAPAYGDFRNPDEPGAGGSGESSRVGGGLVRITAGGRMKVPKGAKPKKGKEEDATHYVYDAVNPAGVALSFAPKSGIFKGKFSLYGEYDAKGAPVVKALSVPYVGILVPVRDGRFDDLPVGMGHCLIPDTDPVRKAYWPKRSQPVWLEEK